ERPAASRDSFSTRTPSRSTAGAKFRLWTRTTTESSGSGCEGSCTMTLGNWSVMVGNPWWLLLLPLIVPPLIWISYPSLAGRGPIRRFLAIMFRTVVITLIVLSLADVQAVRRTDRLTTMFLIDASNSVPKEQQKAALDYVTEASKKRRRDDLSGVVVFG